MSETAQTLIKASLRAINVIASGETPTSEELADGLEALKIMLRSWSINNIMMYFQSQDTLAMTGASYYTIGSGGDVDTTWPVEIKGAVVDSDYNLRIIGEARYRKLNLSTDSGNPAYLWYNPEYPLGKLYPWATGGSSMVIDSLKALTDPTGLTASVQFPTSYDAAIKWNLALQLAPEYGKKPSGLVYRMATDAKRVIESKNLANQINAADLSRIGRYSENYRIDEG